MSTALVWFRNDLRVSDNIVLSEACKKHEHVIGVYCFEPRLFKNTRYGFPKTGKFRTRFMIESVRELKQNLQDLNISLLVFYDTIENQILKLQQVYKVKDVYFQKEWTSEEKQTESILKSIAQDLRFHSYYNQFLYHPEDLPFNNFQSIPRVFTDFRKNIEKQVEVRPLVPCPSAKSTNNLLEDQTKVPNLQDLGFSDFEKDPRTAFPFLGGENNATRRLKDYIWKTENILVYKETRNGLIGEEYSSKLSAWLANGCISPRTIYWEIRKFEKNVKSNQSTYWLIFELVWRDFFKYVSLKHGNAIFQLSGISKKELEWDYDEDSLRKWISGKTDEPFVNANMKEIAATGFMSNRGRQNVNSFWAKELKQDWRAGAAYFESLLIDYDVHSNWGNWMYNSGVGNDPRDRKFNITSQAQRYDPDKKYQDLWLKK